MVRSPSSEIRALRKGAWSPEEDQRLIAYIKRYRVWNWNVTPKASGLLRSGKSCRLRWMNYLRPDIKHGNFSKEEEETILRMHERLGNKWSAISAKLPGRTDNEIKNHWHSHLKKRLNKNQAPRTESSTTGVENNKCDAKLSVAETNHAFSSVTEAPKTAEVEVTATINSIETIKTHSSSMNIPISPCSFTGYPAGQIDEYKTIEITDSSETFGDLSSFWTEPFSMEDLQATYVDPIAEEVWYQEHISPYGFYDDVCSDFWFNLHIQDDADATKEPDFYF